MPGPAPGIVRSGRCVRGAWSAPPSWGGGERPASLATSGAHAGHAGPRVAVCRAPVGLTMSRRAAIALDRASSPRYRRRLSTVRVDEQWTKVWISGAAPLTARRRGRGEIFATV